MSIDNIDPSIFSENPEYRSWKREQEGWIPSSPSSSQEPSPLLGTFGEARLAHYENRAAAIWQRAITTSQTEKARVVEVLSFFPHDLVIPQVVVGAYDARPLKSAMLSLLEEGKNCLGVRTCYLPDRLGTAPNSMGKIINRAKIDDFLANEYPNWIEKEEFGEKGQHLEEIIVLANPLNLGPVEYDKFHFVFITKVDPGRLLTEAALDTSQLRTIEDGDIDNLVEIERPTQTDQPRVRASIGQNYWNQKLINEITSLVMDTVRPMRFQFNGIARLNGLSGKELTISNYEAAVPNEPYSEWPEDDDVVRPKGELVYMEDKYIKGITKQLGFSQISKDVAAQIFDPNYILSGSLPTITTIGGNIYQAISKNSLPEGLAEAIVNPKAWTATKNLKRIVYGEWLKPPMDLYLRLMALNSVCVLPGQNPGDGYDAIEIQGGYTLEGEVEYTKIYAIRGREEKEFAQAARRKSQSSSTFSLRH